MSSQDISPPTNDRPISSVLRRLRAAIDPQIGAGQHSSVDRLWLILMWPARRVLKATRTYQAALMRADDRRRRSQVVFSFGYERDSVIVAGDLRRRFHRLPIQTLAQRGMFDAAVRAAALDGRPEILESVLAAYNAQTDHKVSSTDQLRQMFGVYENLANIEDVVEI